jgi:cytidylate kinase
MVYKMADLIITIDGPAASGKSTAARLLAHRLGASFLDTGAMYRAVTLAAMQAGIDLKDTDKLPNVIQNSDFHFEIEGNTMTVSIDGADVTDEIRKPYVTANVHYIAACPQARERLVEMQRQFAAGRQKIVTEGRDQGTVAFPDADIKFYLTADPTERAKRRQTDLRSQGGDDSLERIQDALEQRDASDQNRAVGPLKPAEDAVIIDTTHLTIDGVIDQLLSWVKKKCL